MVSVHPNSKHQTGVSQQKTHRYLYMKVPKLKSRSASIQNLVLRQQAQVSGHHSRCPSGGESATATHSTPHPPTWCTIDRHAQTISHLKSLLSHYFRIKWANISQLFETRGEKNLKLEHQYPLNWKIQAPCGPCQVHLGICSTSWRYCFAHSWYSVHVLQWIISYMSTWNIHTCFYFPILIIASCFLKAENYKLNHSVAHKLQRILLIIMMLFI